MTNEELAAQLNQRFDQLEQTTKAGFAKVDERFTKVDERFTKVDEGFTKIDQRFAQVHQRFAKADERFGTIDERFKKIEEKLHQNGVLVEEVKDQVKFAIDDVRRVEGKLDRFVTETAKNFANLEARVTILHAGRSRRPS